MAFPRWGGVLPPIPPKGPKCSPPRSPPLWGGAIEIFILENSGSAPPQAPKTPPPFGLFWSKVPPICVGAPQNRRFAPPTVGGSSTFFQKSFKNQRCDCSPPSPKKSPHFTQSPPHLCRSFGGEMLPPKGSRVGGRVPPIFAAPPHCGGD